MPPLRLPKAMLPAAVLCGALGCASAAIAQSSGGGTLAADPLALRGQVTRLRGVLPGVAPGATVHIQRLDPAAGWVAEASGAAGAGGAFVVRWRPRVVGRFTVRAVAAGAAARAATAAPTAPVTVYRPAVATWYGPGLYGHHTACGQVLSHRIMGVAHRTLPCGTPVELELGGRPAVVRRDRRRRAGDLDRRGAPPEQPLERELGPAAPGEPVAGAATGGDEARGDEAGRRPPGGGVGV